MATTNKRLALVIFLLACHLTAFLAECRPQDADKSDTVNVQDTDDEFTIKKPESATDPKYTDFLDELYRHDEAKQPVKSKRDTKINIDESTAQFDIPKKPLATVNSENYDKFLGELYRHDELKRNKRMIVFRPMFVYRKEEIRKEAYKGSTVKRATAAAAIQKPK